MQEADGVHTSSAFSIRFRLNCLCEIEARQFCVKMALAAMECHFQTTRWRSRHKNSRMATPI